MDFIGFNEPQVSAITSDLNKPCLIISGPGSGKCIAGESLIYTDKGIIRIDQIPNFYSVNKDNECLATVVSYGGSFQLKQTSHYYDMGMQKTIRIRTKMGLLIEGTYEHPIFVLDKDGKEGFKRLDQINFLDLVAVSCNNNLWNEEEKIDCESAYFIGLLSGNGYFDRQRDQVIFFTPRKESCDAFNDYFDYIGFKRRGDLSNYCFSSKRLKNFLLDSGLAIYDQAKDREVPFTVLQSSKKIAVSFLQGIFDVGGDLSAKGLVVSFPSKTFCSQLQILLLNFGIPSYFSKQDSSYSITVLREHLNLFRELIGFKKNSNLKERVDALFDGPAQPIEIFFDEIVSIMQSKSTVYDFTVPDTHSFVSNGLISHNTRVLTYRTAYLIEQGISSENIWVSTFTNKAANEMKERLEKIVGASVCKSLWIGTFHKLCLRILRIYAHLLGYRAEFSIYDEDDCEKIIRALIRDQELELPSFDIAKLISKYKTGMIYPADLRESKEESEEIIQIYEDYQNKMLEINAMDFDDLINNVILLMQRFEEPRNYIQNKFHYVLVDEFQDCNRPQAILINLISQKTRRVFAIGDDAQCLEEESKIQTINGEIKAVKDIVVGDMVQTIFNGKLSYAPVTAKTDRQFTSTMKVKTSSGHIMCVSERHKVFASLPPLNTGLWYVYLMWRPDKGYRLGVTKGGLSGLIGSRTHPEKPKKLWFLDQFASLEEATKLEASLSLEYGVPTQPYFHNGRGIAMSQESLNYIFKKYGMNGKKLLEGFALSFDYPHFVPQNTVKHGDSIRNVNLYMGNKKGSCLVTFESNEFRDRKQFSGKNAYVEAREYANEICKSQQATGVIEKFTTEEGYVSVIPASGLMVGMKIPVVIGDQVKLSDIVSIYYEASYVYDLEIAKTGIIIADNVVSHNSIYLFRGADITNILNFEIDYPEATVVKLEQNYRSTKNIIGVSSSLISFNLNQKEKNLWTENESGDKVSVRHCFSEVNEADWIANNIYSLKDREINYEDIAVLYRTNFQSRAIERSLLNMGIPYEIIGGLSFFQRKEIKDLVAYLKIINNPEDFVAFSRIINVPKRGIGDATIRKLISYAGSERISIFEALNKCDEIKGIGNKKDILKSFSEFISSFKPSELSIPEMLKKLIIDLDFFKHLKSNHLEDWEDREENVNELVNMAWSYYNDSPYSTLSDFLEEISLQSNVDKSSNEERVKLMTVHSSKGLEFECVFVCGLEEGIFPHAKSIEENTIEEERRLCYVALSRAKKKLFLSHVKTRSIYGGVTLQSPSRFLFEIDPIYVKEV